MSPILRRSFAASLAALCLTFTTPSVARAQADEKPEDKKGYTLPYFFAMVGVLAVVIAATRPSPRTAEVPQDEEE